MIHLTTSQILQFVDGKADYASQAQCTNHLAVCVRCRNEVEFQKKLAKSARQNGYRASSQFTRRVMARVVPQTRKKLSAKILDNLANIFAMALVLGIMGYAVSKTAGFKESQADPRVTTTMKAAQDFYAKVKGMLRFETKNRVEKYFPQPSQHGERLIVIIVVTLLALGLLDRFVVRQFIKLKM